MDGWVEGRGESDERAIMNCGGGRGDKEVCWRWKTMLCTGNNGKMLWMGWSGIAYCST